MSIRLPTLLFVLLCFSAQAQLRFTKEVNSITELKRLNVFDINKSVNVKGYLTPGDGGGGLFVAEETSSATADGGIIIAPDNNIGRWRRAVTGREYMARWWGPIRTNATLQNAMNWVSSNGWGTVTADGGQWLVKGDDSTRLLMKSGVTLRTAEDSQIVLAPHPTNNWILIDFPIGASDCGVGPARLLGWNLLAPGGDTNKTGLIFSLQDTTNVVIGGIKADNWYTSYADIGSGNVGLKMFDDNWQEGVRAFGAFGDYPTHDDTKAIQLAIHYAERYGRDMYFPPTTNGYYTASTWITNGIPVRLYGSGTKMVQYYYNPEEGIVPRYSSVFTISAHSTVVEGFHFTQVGAWPADETNNVSGWSMPINIHLASNVVVRNCRFEVISKGVSSTGPFTKIVDNIFIRCGITFGAGQRANWLYYESPFPPYTKDPVYRSPLAPLVQGNTFIGSNPYKHVVLFSAAPDFSFVDNNLVDVNVPSGAVIAYSGDAGFTDANGTNIYVYRGLIKDNTFSGSYGANGAITVRLNTDTNLVQTGFVVSNMVSAVVVEGNNISGTGVGIELRKAPGTKIRNNDIRVTSSPIWFIGDCNNVLVDGGHYESTLAGIGATIPFSVGFLAPADFRDITIRNCRIFSPPGDEFAIRNVEPLFVDGFTLENVEFDFQGAVVSGDAPKVIQLTSSRGFINVLRNNFLVTNSLNAGRIALITTTNGGDITFSGNTVFDRTPGVINRRGASLAGRVVKFVDNDVGCLEIENTTDLLVSGNHLSGWTNGPSPLDVSSTIRGVFVGNVISNYSTVSALAANIGVTLGTFANNSVFGNSSGDIVRSTLGKLYVHNNAIQNIGGGLTYPNGTGTGTISDDIYERPGVFDLGAIISPYHFTWQRDGSSNILGLKLDNNLAQWDSMAKSTNVATGHSFLVHTGNTSTNDLIEALWLDSVGNVRPRRNIVFTNDIRIIPVTGDPEGVHPAGIGSIALRSDGAAGTEIYKKTTGAGSTGWTAIGAGATNLLMGTLTPSRIPVASTSSNLIDSPVTISETNVVLRHVDSNPAYWISSNTVGSARFGTAAGETVVDNQDGSASILMQIGGTTVAQFNAAGIIPSGGTKNIGSTGARWGTANLSIGLDIGGVFVRAGAGSPEGVVTAPIGSLWLRTDGTAGIVVYVKESGAGNTGWVPYSGAGYTIDLIKDSGNPATNTTYYVGQYLGNQTTTYTVARSYVQRAGTVKSVWIKVNCSSGSGETVNFSIRLNDTTDFAATSTTMNANSRELLVSGLSQALAVGDFIALKIVTPAWVTPPTAANYWAKLLIE